MRSIGSCPQQSVGSNRTNKNTSFHSITSENNQSWHDMGFMADSGSNFLATSNCYIKTSVSVTFCYIKHEKMAKHVMPSCMKPKDYLLFATSRLVVSVQFYLHLLSITIAIFLYWLTSVMQQTINFHAKYYCRMPISSKWISQLTAFIRISRYTVQQFCQVLRRLQTTNPKVCLKVSAVATLNIKQAKRSSGEELVLPRNINSEEPSGLAHSRRTFFLAWLNSKDLKVKFGITCMNTESWSSE